MPIEHEKLESLLKARFPTADVMIEDLAGDNDHYSATIISDEFEGKSRIEQHKMVQDAVKNEDIHALAIKTKAGK